MKTFFKKYLVRILCALVVIETISLVLIGAAFYSRAHGDDYKFNQDKSLKQQYVETAQIDDLVANFEISKEDDSNFTSIKEEVKSIIKSRYSNWNDFVTVDFSNKDKTALKGKWAYGDHWDWIAYKTLDINSKWIVLVSFDGFDCAQLDKIPTVYSKFFEEKIYMFDVYNKVNRYCDYKK